MARIPAPKAVEETEEFVHVRFRDPDQFDQIRTPEWADTVSDAISKGSKVRMGQRKDGTDWVVQAVLIPTGRGKAKARELAERIIRKIEA